MTVMLRDDLKGCVLRALERLGGRGTITEIAKEIWRAEEDKLRASGDLFFTWQYDMRWAGQKLQHEGKLIKGLSGRRWGLR